MTQLNTPYPAAPQIAAFLRSLGHEVHTVDLSLATALAIYSRAGLSALFDAVEYVGVPEEYELVLANRRRYERIIESVVQFLQGHDAALAGRITRQAWLPQGPRFAGIDYDYEAEQLGAVAARSRTLAVHPHATRFSRLFSHDD